jgi:hypothetical protein
LSSTRVTVTGMHTSCSCVLASTLPLVLEPRGASTLRITIHALGEQGAFARHAVLYTDSKASPQLPITVVGKIYGEERGGALAPTPQEAVASKAP